MTAPATTAPAAVTFTDPDGAQSAPLGQVPEGTPQPSAPVSPPTAAAATSTSPAAAAPATPPPAAPASAAPTTPTASPAPYSVAKLPDFEGLPVEASSAKSNAAEIEIKDAAFRADQIVTIVTEVRVTGVGHVVNKDGKLERIHSFKVIDSLVVDQTIDVFREAFGG